LLINYGKEKNRLRKILADNIRTKETVKYILDSLKPYNEYIDTLNENSFEYENECERVAGHYLEIDEALCGTEIITDESLYKADLRCFAYWAYIREEITWKQLVKQLKDYSNQLLFPLE